MIRACIIQNENFFPRNKEDGAGKPEAGVYFPGLALGCDSMRR